MDDEILKNYAKAGEACTKGRAKARELAKPGEKLCDIAEKLEAFLRDEGVHPAFPVNLSVGSAAAHYTPTADDAAVIGEKDLLKVDFGAHVEGFIVDNAFTVDFSGENGKLVEAAEQALANALSVMKAGVDTRVVGKEIESTITKAGFKPIENLCGHLLDRYALHAGIEVPNVGSHDGHVLQEGEVFAVEPFASTGAGMVHEDNGFCEIYSVVDPKPVRMPASRKVLVLVAEEYGALPFAKRWLQEIPSLQLALNDLARQGVLRGYPLLEEKQGVLVSQAETSVVVEKDSVRVLA